MKAQIIFLLAAAVTVFSGCQTASNNNSKESKLRYRNILLRDFRTVKDGRVINFNIGTTAHAPATLAVLKKHLPPEVRITVWADAPLAPELAGMMSRRFPDVPIVYGDLEKDPSPELLDAVGKADLFLISSGSSIASSVSRSLNSFKARTGKPAGAYAIGCTPGLIPELNKLDFVWLRDPVAAEIAKKSTCPITGWAPDAVFDFDTVDTAAAERFMKENALEPGGFICCIPGQRNTPRWKFFGTPANAEKIAVNEKFEEHDNAPLREIITVAVKEFNLKVLICPEQITEIDLIRPRIYDRLPPEIQRHCVMMDKIWSPDMALGVYRASRGVFGVEIHSQVMAVGSGVPGVLLYPSSWGSKGKMWESVGLSDWFISTDSPDYAERAVAVAREVLSDPERNAGKLRRVREIVDRANRHAITKSFLK